MNIELSPKGIFNSLSLFIGLLLVANIFGIVTKLYLNHDYVYGLIPLFDFDSEQNIPTLYSSITLVACSALLFLIAIKHKSENSPYNLWIGLGLIFIFLSIDEMASIHEQLTEPVRKSLGTSGLLFFAWVIPYGIALTVFVLFYLRFLLRLPRMTMWLFVLSGFVFVSGAIGFELLGGWQDEVNGRNNLLFCLLYTCEELFEMFGVAIFIYTLLSYITNGFKSLSLTIQCN